MAMGLVSNPYKELEVRDNAPLDECKRAYRKLMKQYHPDLGTADEVPFREAKAQRLNEAYRMINEGFKVVELIKKRGFTHVDLFNFSVN